MLYKIMACIYLYAYLYRNILMLIHIAPKMEYCYVEDLVA